MKQKEINTIPSDCFTQFEASVEGYTLPERFTFPFYYEPHPISLLAAKELQTYIENHIEVQHDFGFEKGKTGIGKMFGVLVVLNQQNEVGYLAAFSGKLAGKNHHSRFVPPVFDILVEDGFYKLGEAENIKINNRIEILETDLHFLDLKNQLKTYEKQAEIEITQLRNERKEAKSQRDVRRQKGNETLSASDFEVLTKELNRESSHYFYQLKDLERSWKHQFADIQAQLDPFQNEIKTLKEARKNKSKDLQQQLFEQYTFLNQNRETKSLFDIFSNKDIEGNVTDGTSRENREGVIPPSGAGECAAPKLLQYAFLHQLKPIALAEFWWGQSPSSEIRKHGHFYPACKGKCEPILTHMLDGIEMDENPLHINPAEGKELETVYEDEFLLVINKPADFFSVPGINITDSVASRLKLKYPEATGPITVHRLDAATSGLMLIAKTKEVHQNLQNQFIKRKIKKRYTALLDGIVEQDEGFIDLPIRVDLDDRPRQLVCYEYGKPAQTEWKVVSRTDKHTLIHFFPITGRTHQLRVHASHPLGLNLAIVGDDLYGNKAERLYLHAAYLAFTHPVSGEVMEIEVEAAF